MKRQILIFMLMTISVLSFGQIHKVTLVDSLIVMVVDLTNESCSNSNGSITATAIGGTMPYTYIWNTNPPQFTPTLTNLSAGTYTVTVTDDSLNTASTTVSIINFQPTLIVLQNDTNGQGTGVLTINVIGGTPPYNYQWSANVGFQLYDNISTNLSVGLYTVTVTDYSGYTCVCSNSIINATCSAQYTLAPDTIPHHYIATSYVSGFPPFVYEWSWGDGTFDYTAYPSHTYSVAGNYTICLTITDDLSCTSTFCDSSYLQKSPNEIVFVNVIPNGVLGTTINELSNQIQIYPNPTNGNITIALSDNFKLIEVFNLLGEKVFSFIPNNFRKTTEIDLTNIPKGIYFVKVDNGEKFRIEKIVLN